MVLFERRISIDHSVSSTSPSLGKYVYIISDRCKERQLPVTSQKTAAKETTITGIVQSCPIVAEAPLLVRDLECKLAAEEGVTATLP